MKTTPPSDNYRADKLDSSRRDFLKLAAAAAPLAAADTRPNILFVFPDQHRYDWTGLNPKLPVTTPNLNRLAARGSGCGNW